MRREEKALWKRGKSRASSLCRQREPGLGWSQERAPVAGRSRGGCSRYRGALRVWSWGLSMMGSVPERRRASGTRPGSCSISNLLPSPSFHPRVSRRICCWTCPSCPSAARSPAGAAHHPSETFSLGPTTAFLLSVCVPSRSRALAAPFSLLHLQQVRKPKGTMNLALIPVPLSAGQGSEFLLETGAFVTCCSWIHLQPLSLPFQPKSLLLLLQHRSNLGTPAPIKDCQTNSTHTSNFWEADGSG